MDTPPTSRATPTVPTPAVATIDLPQALGAAGAENPTIAVAEAAVAVARAQWQGARALLLPSLNGGMNYYFHAGNTQTSFGAMREVDRDSIYVGAGAGAIVAGTVAVPGVRIFSPLADAFFDPPAARQVVATRRFEADATRNTILLDVGVAYYDLVGAEGHLAAIRQSLLELREVARLTADQASVGLGFPADADRALAETLLFHQDEQRAEEEVGVASARLTQLLNLDPTVRLQSREGPVQRLELVDPNAGLESLIQLALQYRPEMAARAAAVAASQVRYRQERARPFLPTLSAGYSAGGFGGTTNLPITAGPPSGPFNSRTDFDFYAFWTLQNMGIGNLALQRRRWAEVNEAEAERVVTANRIRDEVAQAYADVAARRRQMGVAERQLRRAKDGFDRDLNLVRARGGRPILVVNSARLLAAARQEYVTALTGHNQAQLRLFVSLGQPPTVAPLPLSPPAP
jgi:outer membrane protein TolC